MTWFCAVLFVPHATAVFIVVLTVLVAVCGANETLLLLPLMTADCVCVMLCVAAVDDALAVRPPLAAADAEFAAGVTTAGFQTGFQTGIALTVLTSQHCLTTQHATVGQQDVVGHAQLQHVEVVQLVH